MKRIYFKADHATGTKRCPDCLEVKSISDFPKRKSGAIYAYCKSCNSKRMQKWSSENRERKNAFERERIARNPERERKRQRDGQYKRKYGISYADVQALLKKQSFRCEICSKDLCENTLVVDHCHDHGKVRGLLCNQCNIWLAPLEKPGFLDKALSYLESHRSGS